MVVWTFGKYKSRSFLFFFLKSAFPTAKVLNVFVSQPFILLARFRISPGVLSIVTLLLVLIIIIFFFLLFRTADRCCWTLWELFKHFPKTRKRTQVKRPKLTRQQYTKNVNVTCEWFIVILPFFTFTFEQFPLNLIVHKVFHVMYTFQRINNKKKFLFVLVQKRCCK